MKLHSLTDHRLLRSWPLPKGGSLLLGSGPRADLILDPRACPQDLLCKLEVEPGAVTCTEMGEAPLRGPGGETFRARLRSGESLTVGDVQLLVLDEEELPEFLVGDAPAACAPTAESDGIIPPAKEPLVLLVRGERGTQIRPLRGEVPVGRDDSYRERGIRLTHPAVSAKHALFLEEPDGFYLVSLGEHGTFLNGVKLERGERKKLAAPSEIRFTRNPLVPRVELATLAELRQAPPQDLVAGAMVGDSLAIQKVRAACMQLGPERIPVIFQGETGTGKELAAALLAWEYNPKKGLTVADCTTFAANMFEAELYGYVKGAFTDAKEEKKGLVDDAEGGVLLLDEVGELPPEQQAKLLRLLQEGKFRRVGGTKYLDADVRFASATNRDLEQMVEEGKFRRDLYERIRGVTVALPPLRERKEDIGAIAAHRLESLRRTIADAAVAVLHGHDWPGNVRELRRMVEIAAIRTPVGGEIAEATVRQLFAERKAKPAAPGAGAEIVRDAPARVEAYERAICVAGLARAGGNWKKAAAELGYHPSAFYRRLQAWGLTKGGKDGSGT